MLRESISLKEFKRIISNYDEKKDFYIAEKQVKNKETRYKLVFEMSKKYDLVTLGLTLFSTSRCPSS